MKKGQGYNRKRGFIALTLTLTTVIITGVLPTQAKAEVNSFFNVKLNDDHQPEVEWAVDMPPENVITETGFEDGDEIPEFEDGLSIIESEGANYAYARTENNIVEEYWADGYVPKETFLSTGLENFTSDPIIYDKDYYEGVSYYAVLIDGSYRWEYMMWTDGLQGVTTDEAYEGTKSFYRLKTSGNKLGNAFNTIYDEYVLESRAGFKDTYDFKNGMQLSLSFMLKNKGGETDLNPSMLGGLAMRTFPFTEWWGFEEPLLVTRHAQAGQHRIYVSNMYQLEGITQLYITTNHFESTETNEGYDFVPIHTINIKEGYIETVIPLPLDMPVGYELHTHNVVHPVYFDSKRVDTNGEWQVINMNSPVANYDYYDVQKLGVSLLFDTTSYGDSYFDNLKLGFASRIELYRDNDLVYEGYDTTYADYQVKDSTAPTQPTDIEITKDDNNEKYITLKGSVDPKENHTYSMKAYNAKDKLIVEREGEVDVSTGISNYCYLFSNDPDIDYQYYNDNCTIIDKNEKIQIPYYVTRNMYLYVDVGDYADNYSPLKRISLEDYLQMELMIVAPKIQPISTILDKDIKVLQTNFIDQLKVISKHVTPNDTWRLTAKATSFTSGVGSLNSPILLGGTVHITYPQWNWEEDDVIPLMDLTEEQVLTTASVSIGEMNITFQDNALSTIITSLDKFTNNETYTSTVEFSIISAP